MAAFLDQLRVAYCLAWATLPALVWAGITARQGHWISAGALLLAAACTFAIPALWSSTIRAYLLSIALIAQFTVFALLYALRFESPINAGVIQSVLYTDFRIDVEEAVEFWWAAATSIVGMVLYLRAALGVRPSPLPWRQAAATAAVFGILVLIYAPYVTEILWMQYGWSIRDKVLRTGYPQSLVFGIIDAINATRLPKEGDRMDILKSFGVKAPDAKPGTRETYVFIIGESARESTWRELEDRNAKDHKLVRYGNVLAQANWSRLSVPLISTGALHREDTVTLPTITDWQRWSGCLTAALSNNASYRFSRGADVKTIIGDEEVIRHNRYDHELIPILAQFLDQHKIGKSCVTLHMVGSHVEYRERYEPRFARFDSNVADERTAMTNDYRNTIVMTQDFVSKVIDLLTDRKGSVFLAFASDHGENLLEINGLREHVSLTPTEYELRVPVLFWANEQFVHARRAQWQTLRANSSLPISTANIVPTLLDAMGVFPLAVQACPQLAGSLMRPLRPEPRFYYDPDLDRHPEEDMLTDPSGPLRASPAQIAPRQSRKLMN